MKVLITGSSGFLAQHLIPKCKNLGWEVIGVDKRPQRYHANKFIQADVRDLGFRDLMNVDYVVHLAFSTNIPNSVLHPKETTADNIDMSIHLLDVCKEAGVKRFVFPSTASLYSNNKTPWTEDMIPKPIEPYSWQKLAIEQACKMYSSVYGLSTVVLRFFQIFGEYQREDTAIAAFLKLKEAGKPITLTKTTAQSSFRSGQRDFVYAGDVAAAMVFACKSKSVGAGEIINISSGKCYTMEEVAKALNAKVKWIERREYEVERHEGNPTKARVLLKWAAKVDIIDWLKKL